MALCEMSFYSKVLNYSTKMTVILPKRTKAPYTDIPVLYLLHGRSDDNSAWLRNTSLERYIRNMNLIVVMPDAGLSYYQDMKYGMNYYTFISEELPKLIKDYFSITKKREHTYIAGMSMGGFGAYKIALNNPERYGCAGSFSGVLDFPDWVEKSMKQKHPRSKIFINSFGPNITKDQLLGGENDLIALATTKKESILPRLFQCCGTEDFIYTNNQSFRKTCEHENIPITYKESRGSHEWGFWDQAIQDFLNWL
jgi:S-formylglutathione hydrolase FrmB